MTVTLYADIYFILNMLLDTLLLYITARITNTPFKLWRIICGALFGTVYALAGLFIKTVFPVHLAAALAVCFISFGKKRPFLNTGVFLLTSALAGGTVYGVMYMAGGNEKFISGMGIYGVLFCVFIALVLTAGYLYICKKNSALGSVHAYITVMGKEYKAFLMKDNGNMLTDPISLDPVIVISKKVFGNSFDNISEGALPLPMRVIPVKTAAGSDILYGFRPEKCLIREFGKAKKREVRAIIALTGGNRFTNTYDGLMPPI